MKILYISHRFPYPPNRGGKIFPFNSIQYLSQKHEVTLCSIARSQQEAEEGRGIEKFGQRYEMGIVKGWIQNLRMIARLFTLEPSTMGYFYSRDLDKAIKKLLANESWDLIIAHCSSVAPYVQHVKGIPKILDFCDMDSQKWLAYAKFKPFPYSWGYWLEGTKLERAEKNQARLFDLCMVTTKAELETLNSYQTGVVTDWIPHGVDTEYFKPNAEIAYDPNTISFVGRMDYYPNQEAMFQFCEHTWPKLRAVKPDLKLVIVGAEPSAQVRELGNLPGVTVTGSVPDVRPYVQGSAVMVAPVNIARGTQNKILESMAMGVPVVTSPTCAGGVDAVAGEHFLVASTPEEYIQAILKILDDAAERNRLAHAGRERVLSSHVWDKAMSRFDDILERTIAIAKQKASA